MAGSVAITSPTSEQLVQPDEWLTAVCGRTVVRICCGSELLLAANAAAAVRSRLEASKAAFAFAKLDTKDVAAASVLQDVGFRVVDVSVSLAMPPSAPRPEAARPEAAESVEVVSLAAMAGGDADSHELTRIAGDCFRYSRFHLDPEFPNAAADEIKRRWVANYLRGDRGDHLWAARVDGRWAGFLAAIVSAQGNAAVIDLIGVDSQFQGRGVGGRLINAFQRHYESKVPMLRVGTQAANAPSIRLYQKMGFRFEQSAFVLHWNGNHKAETHG